MAQQARGGSCYGWCTASLLLTVAVLAPCAFAQRPAACPSAFTSGSPSGHCNSLGSSCTVVNGFFATSVISPIKTQNVNTVGDCCAACATHASCGFWTWAKNPGNNGPNAVCMMFDEYACDGVRKNFVGANSPNFRSGGECVVGTSNDPHFVGAEGTHFDFGGAPGGDFCFISDHGLHINLHMSGYVDTDESGKQVTRTWIRAVGIKYASHAISMESRGDGDARRLHGYMKQIVVDGEEVKLRPGSSQLFEDGTTIKMNPVSADGGVEQDNYDLTIPGLIDLRMGLRPAGPKWRKPEDAQIHFNIDVRSFHFSEDVHGILGQTYRSDRAPSLSSARQQNYTTGAGYLGITQVLGANGDGFLDGNMEDYRSSGLLAADCKFAAFDVESAKAAAAAAAEETATTYSQLLQLL